MAFVGKEDKARIEQEMTWEDRNLPVTFHQLLSRTAERFPNHNAVSFQLFSGPNDKAETLTWSNLLGQVNQAANLFRSLGIGENDVVAYVLPNCNETLVTLMGGAVAGIVNPINPLLEPEQIAAILRETGAKVVVTLKSFPKTDVAQKVEEAVRHAPKVNTILEIDLNRYLTPPKSWIVPFLRPKMGDKEKLAHADYKNFNQELAKQPKTLTFADSTEDRVACYFHRRYDRHAEGGAAQILGPDLQWLAGQYAVVRRKRCHHVPATDVPRLCRACDHDGSCVLRRACDLPDTSGLSRRRRV